MHWITTNLRSFRVMVNSVIRYYPRWRGINALFQKHGYGDTPFHLACRTVTYTYQRDGSHRRTSCSVYTTSSRLVDGDNALILAAIDDTVSLEMVCTLLSEDNRIQY